MPSKKITEPLLPDCYYHIYNRGNNREKIFIHDEDYRLFLDKYILYTSGFCESYAYCLLPNHFHFLIKVKDLDDGGCARHISEQFRFFFLRYALTFNSIYNRRGSLFTKNFRRIRIDKMEYLKYLVYYIHSNPQKHKLKDYFTDYRYSSYISILNRDSTYLSSDNLLQWFNNDIEEFKEFHQLMLEERKIKE